MLETKHLFLVFIAVIVSCLFVSCDVLEDLSNSQYKVGNTVRYGEYNGQSVEWIVLDRVDDKALLLSKYLLSQRQYNSSNDAVTWSDSSIRSWLNDYFYYNAFSYSDRLGIVDSYVANDSNSAFGTSGGRNTYDKVFLLSTYEVGRYCSSSNIQAEYRNGDIAGWWLRSPGYISSYAAFVNAYGTISGVGDRVNKDGGIRPAIWITL